MELVCVNCDTHAAHFIETADPGKISSLLIGTGGGGVRQITSDKGRSVSHEQRIQTRPIIPPVIAGKIHVLAGHSNSTVDVTSGCRQARTSAIRTGTSGSLHILTRSSFDCKKVASRKKGILYKPKKADIT